MEENQLRESKRISKVSIGMPVYNGGQFIRKALDSILAQTFTDFELIISDNASIDCTQEICKEYAERDERIRYVCQTENKGAMQNFTFVLDHTIGEYFMWAAADDYWGREFLQSCVECLDNRVDIGLCFTKFWIVSN